MWLAAPHGTHHGRVHLGRDTLIAVLASGPIGPDISGWRICRAAAGGRLGRMTVQWNLVNRQGNGFDPSGLTNEKSVALMHGHPTAQVRQGERALSIPSVSGANETKERGILCDGQQLALAERPTLRRKIAT